MDYSKLTDLYFEAQTSEQQELKLRKWAHDHSTTDEGKQLNAYFQALDNGPAQIPEGLERRMERSIEEWGRVEHHAGNRARTTTLRWVAGMAACFALVFSMGTALNIREDKQANYAVTDTYDNPQDAYQETQRALRTFSLAINKGLDAIDKNNKQ